MYIIYNYITDIGYQVIIFRCLFNYRGGGGRISGTDRSINDHVKS